MGDLVIGAEDVEVAMEPDGNLIGLTVFVRGHNPDDPNATAPAGFIMLDHTIGEYDMMTKVGFVEFEPFDNPSRTARYTLGELPDAFDRFGEK